MRDLAEMSLNHAKCTQVCKLIVRPRCKQLKQEATSRYNSTVWCGQGLLELLSEVDERRSYIYWSGFSNRKDFPCEMEGKGQEKEMEFLGPQHTGMKFCVSAKY